MSLSTLERIHMRETIRAARAKYSPVVTQSGRKRYIAGSVDVNFMCDLLESALRELDEIDWRMYGGVVRHDASEKPKKRDFSLNDKNVDYSEYVLGAYHGHSFFEIVRYDFRENIWINDEYRVIPVECWYDLPKK